MQPAVVKTWREDYQALLESQRERGVHPLAEDNPDIFAKVTKSFLEIFNRAPAEEKQRLATSPLFPEMPRFQGDISREHTRPLNYIMFTANKVALEAIKPYLKREDWLREGPYDSTFVHCVISGMEKNATRGGGDPVGCVKELLKIDHHLARQANRFGATPQKYLKTVIPKLKGNLEYIKDRGGGGYGGMNKYTSPTDCKGGFYNESESDYEILLSEADELMKLL